MGLGEFFQQTATTILLFKADVSDAKRGLKELSGEEKKAAEQAIKLAEARNKAMERVAKGITAANVVMKLSGEAVKFAGDAWETYEKRALAAGGADAEKAKQFRSALNEMDRSIDSFKGAIGRLVVSMEPLLRAVAFVVDKVAWAIEHIPDIPGLGGSEGLQREIDAERAKHSFSYAGYAKNALAPHQARATAAGGLITASALQTAEYVRQVTENIKLDAYQQGALDVIKAFMPTAGAGFSGAGQWNFKQVLKGMKAPKRGGGGGGDNAISWDEYYANTRGVYSGNGSFGDGSHVLGGFNGGMVDAPTEYAGVGGYGGADFLDNIEAIKKNVAALELDRKQSVIQNIFGDPQEFDAYAAKFQLLADSVGVFSGALQAGFEAWKSGSMSATEALEGVFKATISGLASTMFAHALEEGALAVGALARGIGGNPQGFVEAAAHGKAAAAYGAAGIGIGAIARGLSGGNGGGGSGGGGGYSGPPSGGYSGGDHRSGGGGTTIVYVGDGWSTTPGQQRQNFATNQRKARRELAQTGGVRDM